MGHTIPDRLRVCGRRGTAAGGATSGNGPGDEEVSDAAGDNAAATGEDEADPGEADPGDRLDWMGESVGSRPTEARQPSPGELAGSGEAGPDGSTSSGEAGPDGITGSGEAGAGETSPGKAGPGRTDPASEEAGTDGADAEAPSPGMHGACTRPFATSGAVDGSGSSSNSRRTPRPVPAA